MGQPNDPFSMHFHPTYHAQHNTWQVVNLYLQEFNYAPHTMPTTTAYSSQICIVRQQTIFTQEIVKMWQPNAPFYQPMPSYPTYQHNTGQVTNPFARQCKYIPHTTTAYPSQVSTVGQQTIFNQEIVKIWQPNAPFYQPMPSYPTYQHNTGQVMNPFARQCKYIPHTTTAYPSQVSTVRMPELEPCCSCYADLQFLKDQFSGGVLNVVLKKSECSVHKAGECYCEEDCGGTWESPTRSHVKRILDLKENWIPCLSMIPHIEKVCEDHQLKYGPFAQRLEEIFPGIDCKKRVKYRISEAKDTIAMIKQQLSNKGY